MKVIAHNWINPTPWDTPQAVGERARKFNKILMTPPRDCSLGIEAAAMPPEKKGGDMRKTMTMLTGAAVLIASSVTTTTNVRADGGRVAAGLFGGLAVGTLLGAAASRPYYYAPAPVYVEPAPVYVAPRCYWTRGEPVWDDWRGVWYRPRIQVCE